ncbi:PIR protein [Plasmodium ovale]|uniref:PIR protein n=1 Tax=Plasmodium ovale TaxID=36330 RepID=A0A1C3KHT9_PLAOA|nr:PIR protein [Plasmodium ovale]
MESVITLNDLPSKKYYDELKGLLSYDKIVSSVYSESNASYVYTWGLDLDKNLRGYLDKYESDTSITNGTKRCRDLIYILDNIIKQIKNSTNYASYDITKQTIETFINSVVRTYGCDTTSRNAIEDDIKEDMKTIDDFMEVVKYIKDKNLQINSSPKCPEISSDMNAQQTIVKELLNEGEPKYSAVLKLHDDSITKNYEDIVKNIICTSSESAAYLGGERSVQYQHSGGNAPTIDAISLPGIPLIFFFLYKYTHLGTLFNNRIGNKIKFWNNTYEEPNEILDINTEYIHTNTNNEEYNILYDSTSIS